MGPRMNETTPAVPLEPCACVIAASLYGEDLCECELCGGERSVPMRLREIEPGVRWGRGDYRVTVVGRLGDGEFPWVGHVGVSAPESGAGVAWDVYGRTFPIGDRVRDGVYHPCSSDI